MSLTAQICKTCNEYKSLDRFSKILYFTKNGVTKYYYLHKCKDCKNAKERQNNPNTKEKRKQIRATYYKNNKSKIRSKGDQYYQRNRDALLAAQKEYQAANKDKVRLSKRKSEIKKMKTDPSFKLRKQIKSTIRNILISNGGSKAGKSFLKYVCYSMQDLKEHLEKQFEPWMNWNNRSSYLKNKWNDNDPTTWTWQLDHIIPQYKLPYSSMEDENFKKCWDLENLRPLSAKQNLLDGVNKTR